MKAPLSLALVSLSAFGLSACASMDEQDTYAAPPAAAASTTIDEDQAYVAYVEHMARIRGIEVVWVHVPQKRIVAEQSDD